MRDKKPYYIMLFKRFLENNKIFDIFCNNLKADASEDLDCLFGRTTAPGFISGAFYWYKTPQGHDYWQSINDKWLYYYELHIVR